jgi:hypothetical protein
MGGMMLQEVKLHEVELQPLKSAPIPTLSKNPPLVRLDAVGYVELVLACVRLTVAFCIVAVLVYAVWFLYSHGQVVHQKIFNEVMEQQQSAQKHWDKVCEPDPLERTSRRCQESMEILRRDVPYEIAEKESAERLEHIAAIFPFVGICNRHPSCLAFIADSVLGVLTWGRALTILGFALVVFIAAYVLFQAARYFVKTYSLFLKTQNVKLPRFADPPPKVD